MNIAWGNKVSAAFIARLQQIASAFPDPDGVNDLMSCMAFESAETFSPTIRNAAGSGAIGLIQFMPLTAEGLGTSVAELANMNAVEQLDVVEKYFKPYAHRIESLSDLYMSILLPKAIGLSDDSALFTEGTTAFRQNSGLDANSDGIITKAEATAMVAAKKAKGLRAPNVLFIDG